MSRCISTARARWAAIRPRADKRGLNTKLHLAVEANGMPVRMAVTAGTVVDCTQAEALIDGIEAECLLADLGYDTNRVLSAARARGMTPVIPPKRSRKLPQGYDAALYRVRHLVESCFEQLKEWRGVATRYSKKAASYLAICQIRALALWAKVICLHALESVVRYPRARFGGYSRGGGRSAVRCGLCR